MNYLNRTYSFTNFSSFDEGIHKTNTAENSLKKELESFGITVVEQAVLSQLESGRYEWKVDQVKIDDQLINGVLTVDYYDDGTVKDINQQIVKYDKVNDIQIKSEKEAFDEILEGRFKYFLESERINEIQIEQVDLSYELDSKGFYQPVYEFTCFIDDESTTIIIPGIK